MFDEIPVMRHSVFTHPTEGSFVYQLAGGHQPGKVLGLHEKTYTYSDVKNALGRGAKEPEIQQIKEHLQARHPEGQIIYSEAPHEPKKDIYHVVKPITDSALLKKLEKYVKENFPQAAGLAHGREQPDTR